MRKRIEFQSIPQLGGGQYALGIYPPGTFIDNKFYNVFLGGCGHGAWKTLAAAKTFLLACALHYCDRKIAEARAQIEHYTQQRHNLERDGLIVRAKASKS